MMPFAFWKSAGASFDPATLSLSGWWRADGSTGYSVAVGTGTFDAVASAGTSGTNGDLTEGTNPPSVGTAVNGHNPPDFDGTDDLLNASAIESDLFAASAGSIAVLYYADTTDAANTEVLDDEALFAGAGGFLCVTVNNTGARVMLNSGGQKKIQLTGGTSGAWHLMQVKWDGTNLKARVDSGSWTSTSCGDMGDLTSAIKVGCNYNASSFFDGRIAEVITAASTLSDADFDDLITYVNARYGLSL